MNEKSVFYISNINFIDGQNAENLIDLSFMPPMTRRKLSLVDKAALSVMHKAYNGNETEIVFASQYGELDRLDKIIAQYQEDNEVSPFTFSTSVHNCVAGQFSLLNKIKKSYNALAAGENTFSAGLLESLMCAQKGSEVLYCFADAYKKLKAFGCVISATPIKDSVKIELSTNTSSAAIDAGNEFENFKNFCESKTDSFSSSDKVFFIVRSQS